jgi:hypothetical protein
MDWKYLLAYITGTVDQELLLRIEYLVTENQQLPLSSRRNGLPMKRIYGSLLMRHEHAARALVELMQIGKTPSGADPVLHHPPEPFDGIEMVATMSRQYMQPKLLVPVGQRRRELFRPVDATAVGDHDHLFPSVAKEGHHLMDILAQPLRVKLRDDLIDNARGAILHGADDAEQHAAGDPAPGAIAYPRLAFEGFLAFDLTLAQRARGKASALHFAPPARAGQGKAPQDRFIFIEQNNLATAGPVLQRGKFDRSPRQFSRVGSEPPRGTAVAYVFFFNTARTLSRLSGTPVWRARAVASS